MFTIEFEKDAAVIVTLDEEDRFEDVELVLAEEGVVYVRQFDDKMQEHQVIYMSYQQLLDLFAAMQQPEGSYYIDRS
jgi:hypothetical protein